jgi:hypothetical protein
MYFLNAKSESLVVNFIMRSGFSYYKRSMNGGCPMAPFHLRFARSLRERAQLDERVINFILFIISVIGPHPSNRDLLATVM